MLASVVAEVLDAVEPPPPDAGHAAVRSLGDANGPFVGWEDERTVVLLLPPQHGACPRIELRNLDVIPAAEILLRVADHGGDPARHQVAIIRCRTIEPGLRVAFENIAAALCSRLEEEGSLDLAVQIPGLERLFTALDRDALTTVVGLWGELVLIVHARDPVEAVTAWHADPSGTFDFRTEGQAIEVKATRDAAREHWITLSQWRSREHTSCELASLIVPPLDSGGTSIADLLRRGDERLAQHPEARSKLVEMAARTLGRDFALAARERFDLDAALSSLRFISIDEVPAATFEPGVLDARWKASLSYAPSSPAPRWPALTVES
jgi:hypothetical protein